MKRCFAPLTYVIPRLQTQEAQKQSSPEIRAALAGVRTVSSFLLQRSVWSVIGVSLWPLFYAHKITFYPSIVHARLMLRRSAQHSSSAFSARQGQEWPRHRNSRHRVVARALRAASGMCLQSSLSEANMGRCMVHRSSRHADGVPRRSRDQVSQGMAASADAARAHGSPVRDLRRGALAFSSDTNRRNACIAWLACSCIRDCCCRPCWESARFVFPRMLGGDFGDPKRPRKVAPNCCDQLPPPC